jgi:hypothetical protein
MTSLLHHPRLTRRSGTEEIVAAAISQDGLIFSAPRPARHHTVMHAMVSAGISTSIVGEQGFLTSAGVFVDRKTAFALAVAAGQVSVDKYGLRELFSEDLW